MNKKCFAAVAISVATSRACPPLAALAGRNHGTRLPHPGALPVPFPANF